MELGEVVNVSGRNSGGTEAGSDQRTQQQWANMAHTPGTGQVCGDRAAPGGTSQATQRRQDLPGTLSEEKKRLEELKIRG